MDVAVDGEKLIGWDFEDKWKPPSYAAIKARRKMKSAVNRVSDALSTKLSQTLVKPDEDQVDYLAEMAVNGKGDAKEAVQDQDQFQFQFQDEDQDQDKHQEREKPGGRKGQGGLQWYKPNFTPKRNKPMPPKRYSGGKRNRETETSPLPHPNPDWKEPFPGQENVSPSDAPRGAPSCDG